MPTNTTPIYERGVPAEIRAFIWAELKAALADAMWQACAIEMDAHQMIWGVPCGPTLSMAHPPVLRGILNG